MAASRFVCVLAASFALVAGGCQTAPAEPPQFNVVESDARIAYASSINGFQRVDDDTFLLRVGANRWYRAELFGNCAHNLQEGFHIGVDPSGAGDVQRGSTLLIDERRCRIESLDRVELVKPEEAGAQAS